MSDCCCHFPSVLPGRTKCLCLEKGMEVNLSAALSRNGATLLPAGTYFVPLTGDVGSDCYFGAASTDGETGDPIYNDSYDAWSVFAFFRAFSCVGSTTYAQTFRPLPALHTFTALSNDPGLPFFIHWRYEFSAYNSVSDLFTFTFNSVQSVGETESHPETITVALL